MTPSDTHPPDCLPFDYEHHPDRGREIPRQVARVLRGLRDGSINTSDAASDTRQVHEILFANLTPSGHSYYAGHYRGENYRCLRRLEVRVGNHRGYPSYTVPGVMAELARTILAAVAALDMGNGLPNATVPPEMKLLHTVQVACRFFELVCRVHLYANGNGHAARFCLWAILVRYGYFPTRWPIEPRPPDPPYTQMLINYQAGIREPLERHILQCLS